MARAGQEESAISMSYVNAGCRLRLVASTLEANYEAARAEIPSGPPALLPDLGSLPPTGLPLRGPHRLRDSQLRSGSPKGAAADKMRTYGA